MATSSHTLLSLSPLSVLLNHADIFTVVLSDELFNAFTGVMECKCVTTSIVTSSECLMYVCCLPLFPPSSLLQQTTLSCRIDHTTVNTSRFVCHLALQQTMPL